MSTVTTYSTIGDFIEGGMSLTAHCESRDCVHYIVIDLPALADRLGAAFDVYENNLRPRFRCTACGHLGAAFTVSARVTAGGARIAS